MSEREVKILSIPEGLDQERSDAALARLLGLSRSVVVLLLEAGEVTRKGKPLGKSDKVGTGDLLEILMPAAKSEPTLTPTPVEGLSVIYNDDHIIVIDKPAGVAAHPSPGWTGPTVIGAIIAAGYNVSTSGAAERQGIVHRLDVGTTGLMVVAKDEPLAGDDFLSLKENLPANDGFMDRLDIFREPFAFDKASIERIGKQAVDETFGGFLIS